MLDCLFIRCGHRYRYRHSLDFYSTAIQEDAFLRLQTREASRDFPGIPYLLYSGGVPVNEGTIPDSVTGGTRSLKGLRKNPGLQREGE
ncbi:hypothetical protein HOLleu_38310 [Holothuria leucospilota]|uniref:Uncharacterized protein n=1 Tax=Holothuria leucospilota TaxID=206669 RepID=A0A9Q0YJ61_HOLLE|nr:hypothetical protein HOLleu_38310 [Holothuria leucospilota]